MITTEDWEKVYCDLYSGKPLENSLTYFLAQKIGDPKRQISFLKNCVRWYKRDGEPSFRSIIYIGKGDLYTVVNSVRDLFEVKIPMQLEALEELLAVDDISKKSKPGSTSKKPNITAPVIALFCTLISDSLIDKKNEKENVITFCQRVCKAHNLNYTDRVRQNFPAKSTKKNIKKVKELILPTIVANVCKKITEHIDNNDPSKQNLYA